MATDPRPRILSGIQPSGTLHLGNYFGLIRPAVALQERGDAFYFIADYHALTTVRDPARLRALTREAAIDLLACGIDPERATLFRQSDVPEVAELALLLGNLTSFGLLSRGHAYKDKTARGLDASLGLFAYPVLMAADILLYDAALVPIGRDQLQHLEMTRDIATKMNEAYGSEGPLFTLPRADLAPNAELVPGLDGQKMSKSYGNTIEIALAADALRAKVMKIKTDATPLADPKPIEGSTILSLYRLVASPAEVAAMEGAFARGGTGYGAFKATLADAIVAAMAPIRARRLALLEDESQVDRALERGAERARVVARATVARVKRAMGLR